MGRFGWLVWCELGVGGEGLMMFWLFLDFGMRVVIR